MALPGLSLPGLGLQLSATPVLGGSAAPPAEQLPRREDLPPRSEWRFETSSSSSSSYHARVLSGHAELFGVELAVNQLYDLSGTKGAIFTWQGCQLEFTGDAESEYAAEETEYAVEWLSLHGMLETFRDERASDGPRVLVVGSDSTGKSSLIRCVTAWAVSSGRTPTVVNLDPRQGLLAPPSGLTAVTIGSQMEVENGFGISPISGPTVTPMKTPLVYHYPYPSPTDKSDVYKAIVTRLALSTTSKLEEDPKAKQSGIILDTPGVLGVTDGKGNINEILHHLVSEFSINVIVSMGPERLTNALSKRYSVAKGADEAIPVLRVAKPGGLAERNETYLKQSRARYTRSYFFGSAKESLSPHSHSIAFDNLVIYRAHTTSTGSGTTSYGADADDDYDPSSDNTTMSGTSIATFDKVAPSVAMTGSLIAIKFCPTNSDEDAIRDSAVMGFVYVADVDEARKKVRFLAPHPQSWGNRALVWGQWPEAMADLVT
ncbi:Cleavage polyadenylation factor subunit clp1 [Recurvomyces mirabilis]|nr:Cleavage polyadenylation factor subunit clp1 [Recurvomyces mirabilis]